MAFGKAFKTLKEARAYAKKRHPNYKTDLVSFSVRLMPKRLFPRRTKRYHVGTYMDYLNFA